MAEAPKITTTPQTAKFATELLNPIPKEPPVTFGQKTKGFGEALSKAGELAWGNPAEYTDIQDIINDYQDGKITIRQRNDYIRKAGESTLQGLVHNYGPFYAMALNVIKDVRSFHDNVARVGADEIKKIELENKKAAAVGKPPVDATRAFLQVSGTAFLKSIVPELQALFSIPVTPFAVGAVAAGDLSDMMGFGPKTRKLVELLVNTGTMLGPMGRSIARSQADIGDAMNAVGSLVKGAGQKLTEPIAQAEKSVPTGLEALGGMGGELGSSVESQVMQAAQEAVIENLQRSGKAGAIFTPDMKARLKSLESQPDLATRLANFREESQLQARGVQGMVRGHAAAVESAQQLPDYIASHYRPLDPGTVLNQEKSLKLNATIHSWVADFLEKSDRYLQGDKTIYESLKTDLANLLTPVRDVDAALREGGRAGEIVKELSDPRYLRRFWQVLRSQDAVSFATGNDEASFSNLLGSLKQIGTPDEIRRFLHTTMEAMKGNSTTLEDNIHTAYLSILFAKPATWIKKASGDTLMAVDSMLQKSAAGYMSDNQVNGVMKHEGITQFKATMLALQDAIGQAFGKQQQMGPANLPELVRQMPNFMEHYHTPDWAAPLKVFESITDFAQNINIKTGLYNYAWREGVKQGLNGEALTNFIAKEMETPSLAALQEGTTMAVENTALAPLGKFAKAVKSITRDIPVVGPYIFPVFNVGANLTNRALSNVPGANLLTRGMLDGLAEGGRARDLVLGRLLMADVSSYFMSGLAKMGWLTGSGPATRPGQNFAWRKSGQQPNSVMLGGDWYNINPLEPLGKHAAVVADFAYNADYTSGQSALDIASAMSAAGLKNSIESSYWPVFTDFVRYFENLQKGDITTSAAGILGLAVKSPLGAVGGGPMVQTWQQQNDPYVKNYQGEWDRFKVGNPITNAAIPTFFDEVPYQHDIFTGEKVPMPAPWGSQWFRDVGRNMMAELTPFSTAPVDKNPRYQKILDLGVTIPRTDFVIAGKNAPVPYGEYNPQDGPQIKLDANQQEDLINRFSNLKSQGKTLAQAWDQATNDPRMKNASVDDQRKVYQAIVEGYWNAAKETMFADRKDLQLERLSPQIQRYLSSYQDPQERAAKEQEINDHVLRLDVDKPLADLNAAAEAGQGQ